MYDPVYGQSTAPVVVVPPPDAAAGVTLTVEDAALVPTEFVAVTEQL